MAQDFANILSDFDNVIVQNGNLQHKDESTTLKSNMFITSVNILKKIPIESAAVSGYVLPIRCYCCFYFHFGDKSNYLLK